MTARLALVAVCGLDAFCLIHPALFSAPLFYLHNGDTVVFYGDSITHQRLYTTYTEAFVLTRFPHMAVRFINSGWGGDRVSGGGLGPIDQRLDRDVLAYRPTAVTIMLGMNDGEYRAFDPVIFDKFATGYRHILARLRAAAPDARITLLQPSPYDDVTRSPKFKAGYNQVLVRYGGLVKDLAKSEGLTASDVNSPIVDLLRAAAAFSPERAVELIPDRVHPSPGVHLVMACALLKSWNAPAVVSAVEIDAAQARAIRTVNTHVDSIRNAKGIEWRELDESLPMPLDDDSTIELAVRSSPLYRSLNEQTVSVQNLNPGRYRLEIDGSSLGTFDRDQLMKGVSLTGLETPMAKQAKTVLRLTFQHNVLHYARWAMVQTSLQDYRLPRTAEVTRNLDALEDDVVALQRAAAMPKPHAYRVVPLQSN